MKINKLNITAFGGLKEKTIELSDGINVFFGENESGKSTICAFLEAMLYGMNKPTKNESRMDIRSKYLPWSGSSASGSIEFTFNEKNYVLERKFGKTKRSDKATLRYADTWEECFSFDAESIGYDILGLSEESFVKSVFMGQLQTGISGKDDEIIKKLSNLSSTGDEEASFSTIENILQTAKYSIIPKATAKSIMGDLLSKKEALLCEEKEIEAVNESLIDYVSELNETCEKIEHMSLDVKKLAQEKEEARKYEKFLSDGKIKENIEKLILRKKESEEKVQSIKQKIESAENELRKYDKTALNEAISCINTQKSELEELKINQLKLENEKEKENSLLSLLKTEKNKSKKTSFAILLGFALVFLGISLGCAFLLNKYINANVSYMLSVMFFVVFAVLSVFGFFALKTSKKYEESAKQTERKLEIIQKNIYALQGASGKSEILNKTEDVLQEFNANSEEDLKKQLENCLSLESKLEILNKELSFSQETTIQIESDIKSAEKMLSGAKECEKTRMFDEVDTEYNENIRRISELEKRKKELELNIERKGEGLRTLDLVRSELSSLEPEIDYYNSVHSSLEIALSVLKECEEELKSGFSPELNKSVNEILAILTNNKYTEIKLSDDYTAFIKEPENSEIKNAENLSGGTYDLIYFAIRLGILKNIFPEKIPLLVLDDTFLQLDDERQKLAINYLSETKELVQGYYFTCHKDVLNKFMEQKNISVVNL